MAFESEADEIARAAAGDRAAQSALVNRHMPRAYAVARRMLRSDEDAEDVTQEAFLRAWKALPNWEPRAKFSTWLYRVTLNLCYDRLRKKRETLMDEPPEREDDAPRPEQALAARQEKSLLDAAIAELPDRQKAAITLCAIEGFSNIEAAEMLEASVEAVESLLARARRALKSKLADRMELSR
ncbi:MAG: RNA polymerase sigma factor [Pseudomonadota bacterium]